MYIFTAYVWEQMHISSDYFCSHPDKYSCYACSVKSDPTLYFNESFWIVPGTINDDGKCII